MQIVDFVCKIARRMHTKSCVECKSPRRMSLSLELGGKDTEENSHECVLKLPRKWRREEKLELKARMKQLKSSFCVAYDIGNGFNVQVFIEFFEVACKI